MAFSICFSGFPVLSSLVMAFTSLQTSLSLHCYHMSLFLNWVPPERCCDCRLNMCFYRVPPHEMHLHCWLCKLDIG